MLLIGKIDNTPSKKAIDPGQSVKPSAPKVKWSHLPISIIYSPIICSVILRSLDLISNSMNTICCQVPSIKFLSLKGTVKLGPIKEALTCEGIFSAPWIGYGLVFVSRTKEICALPRTDN